MLIQKINIKEYRGIKKCNNPIEFSPFTVLIGRNNSGKSTILEALSLLPIPSVREFVTDEIKIEFLRHLHRSKEKYQYDTTTGPPIESNESLLYQYTGTSEIEYTSVDNKVYTLFINEKDEDLKIEGIEKIDFMLKYVTDFFHIDSKNDLSASVVFVPNDTKFINKMENKMKILKNLIVKKGSHVKVAESISKCVDDEYSDINFSEPITMRKILPDNFIYIHLRDLGAGAEKIVKIMTLIDAINPELVLIDDFGAGLHPSLIRIVLECLKEANWQTVIATHSIDVLYRLTWVGPPEATIVQLKKSHDDILSNNVLYLEELESLLNANSDPRLLVDALGL